MKNIFKIILLAEFLIVMNTIEGQKKTPDCGDIFHEDFHSDKLTHWKDMKAWGFGVWQMKDHKLISIDPQEPTKGIVAILPDFQQSVVNRDFSALFHFRPVRKKDFLFIVDFRNQGVNSYRIEIDKNGRLSIVKNIVSHLPRKLSETEAGRILFEQWQWLRLDVRGEKPVRIGVKIWRGDRFEEPKFYQAFSSDFPGLTPENLNFALTVMQSGGSRVEINRFDIFSKIPVQKIWQWHDGKNKKEKGIYQTAFQFFQSSQLQIAKDLLLPLKSEPAVRNNLALIEAERGNWREACELIHSARKMARVDKIIAENAKWIWYASVRGGMSPPAGKLGGYVRLEKQVFLSRPKARLDVFANKTFARWPDNGLILKIKIFDEEQREIRSFENDIAADEFGEIHYSEVLDLSAFEDGKYQLRTELANKNETIFLEGTEFEILFQRFSRLALRLENLENWYHSNLMVTDLPQEKNNLANLKVILIKLNQQLNDCDAPGNFALYQDKMEAELVKAEQIVEEMKKGENPFENQKGTFLRGYYSEIDGSVQAYALFVPEKYESAHSFPLVVNLHGYDPSFSSCWENIFLPIFMPHMTKGGRYIVVNPFGRGNTMYQNFGEKDVLEVISEVKRLYNIDSNRIYLTGGSMGGGGTWYLGLTHADMFAAIAPIMGPTDFSFWTGFPYHFASPAQKFFMEQRSPIFYAENALNLPIYCNHGVLDDIVPIEQSRKIVKRLQELGYNIRYVEHPEAAHGGFDQSMDESIFDWFENLQQEPHPEKVVLKAGDLNHASAYWVEILQFIDILQFAKVEASVEKSKIRVATENVEQFKLKLASCPIAKNKELRIKVDGTTFILAPGLFFDEVEFRKIADKVEEKPAWEIFSKKNDKKLVKKKGLTGPLVDVFNAGFLVVYGTKGSEEDRIINFAHAIKFQNQWRKWQHVLCRIKADYAVTEQDIEQFNLILLGSPKENLLSKKVSADLPVSFLDNGIRFGDKEFFGKDVGIAMIYPNPLNPERYIVIYGGNSWQVMIDYSKDIGMDFDYQIFDSRTLAIHILQGNLTVAGTPLLCGYFDQEWKINEKYQWLANEDLRKAIKPRKQPNKLANKDSNEIYLSEMEIDSVNYWTGGYEFDRSIWGEPFALEDKVFEKGLGVFPPITFVYKIDGTFDIFSAIFTASKNPFWPKDSVSSGKMQLAIYGDGEELYLSPAIDAHSAPVSVNVGIAGVKDFILKVRTQDWLPNFEQAANLVDAKFIRKRSLFSH